MTFVKGQVTNPNGRPKTSPMITPLVKKYMVLTNKELKYESQRDDLTQAEHIAIAITREMKRGSTRHLATIWDRLDGKLVQSVDHTTDGQALPTPILQLNVPRDISHEEDNEA